MKKFTLILVLIGLAWGAMAQSTLRVAIRLMDKTQKPMPNVAITFAETQTQETVLATTDGNGVVDITLNSGKEWEMRFFGIVYRSTIEMPDGNKHGMVKRQITYDPKVYARLNRERLDRSAIQFTDIDQKRLRYTAQPSQTDVKLTLRVVDSKRQPVSRTDVALVQAETAKRYISETDDSGEAVFQLPNGVLYEIDVAGQENYNQLEVPQTAFLNMTKTVIFEPTRMKEKRLNDTIIQQLRPDQNDGTSTHVFVSIELPGAEEGDWLYLNKLKSTEVYKAKLDAHKVARFLMPKDAKYMIHHDFQRDIDVVDLVHITGIGRVEKHLQFRPDPRLQDPLSFIPTPDRLFLTDFNKFLEQELPKPEAGKYVDFFLRWANAVGVGSREALLELTITTASKDRIPAYNKPVNLAFVLDKSGSMAGYDRIESLQAALLALNARLNPNDVVSMVSFESDPELLRPASARANGSDIDEEVKKLIPGGGTNIYKGMIMGYEELRKNYKEDGVNRLVLLTDGYGETEVPVIVAKSKEYNAMGLETSTIGVGQDYNAALLELLASQGGGMLHFTIEASGLANAFDDEMQSILRPVAHDAVLEIEYNQRIVLKQILGYPMQTVATYRSEIELKHLYADMGRVAYLKFQLNKPDRSIEKEPVVIRLRFTDLDSKPRVVEKRMFLNWQPGSNTPELVTERHQKKLYAIATMNQALKVMAEAYAQNQHEKALQTLQSTLEQMRALFPKADDADVRDLMAQLDNYVKAFAQQKKNSLRH